MYKLFFQIILLHSIAFCHQFFLTTTEVRLSDNQKSLEISIQTFTHDLSDNLIIQDHYWRYLGKKIDGDFTLFFLEIDKFNSPSNVAVFNTIFMDMYEKQQNILNVYGTKTVQSSTMTVEEPAFKFEL